ncbi:TonB-dependent receptor [Pontibacter sp. JAM-7]|uniref:TonB-dependent receptor n=1 Tax=Pontibacter sp. JAM-7 TaxID=3366581 RepID=UPI003AF75352
MSQNRNIWLPLIAGALVMPSAAMAEDVTRLQGVTVIGTTPLHGAGLEKKRVAAAVQTATSEDLEKGQALNLAEHLRNNFSSVTINEAVNNPYQPDVQYRGFTASPLLGLPQGLSVYVNGIRFNEPFGDTVNWDLLPEGAIDSINLFAGSNPVFGQNTLGGALSIKTKNGFDNPGSQIETSIGEDGRFNLEAQTGGNDGQIGYYVIGNYYEEDGWRDYSPSEVKQGLATLSWRGEDSSLELTAAANDNQLIGNGAAPELLLKNEGRESIYTQPDQTETELRLLSLAGDAWLNDNVQVSGTLYYRDNKINTLNGDDSDYEECDDGGFETLCEGDEDDPMSLEPVEFAGYGSMTLEEIDPTLDPDELDGTLNTSSTEQESMGLASQLTFLNDLMGKENQLTVGFNYDAADIDFRSDTQFAVLRNDSLSDDRGVSGIGLYDVESQVRLNAKQYNIGLFFTDTLALNDTLDLTFSGRYSRTRVKMEDLLEDGEGSLDGSHSFNRFNPAVGLAWNPNDQTSWYASYSESSRAPTPAELSCADPDDPCKLPNGFVSDPPLEQVVAKTVEVGVRGNQADYQWNAGIFHTMNHDDIIFQQAGDSPSEGYFANVGKTRRLGLELAAQKQYDNLSLGLSYTWLEATFRTPYTSFSPNHPLGGDRQVDKGDDIPGLPQHVIKLVADWTVTSALDLGVEVNYQSSQFFRGDEANDDDKLDGFAVINLRGQYKLSENVELFAKIDNLFDKEYETFGVYGEAEEVLGSDYDDEVRFVGPGKPRTGVIGLRARF